MNTLVDERNQELWDAINSRYTVSFKPSFNDEHACHIQGDSVTFSVVEDRPSKDAFTHEMLHVYLSLKENYIGAALKRVVSGSNILRSIFSDALLEHAGNCLDHVKMLPLYLKMGFDREQFLLDYHEHKCSDNELSQIKKHYRSGKKLNLSAVDFFLGKVFAVLADPNPTLNYTLQKQELKRVDSFLFSITEKLFNNWHKVNLESTEPSPTLLNYSYQDVAASYYQDLKQWITLNKITK